MHKYVFLSGVLLLHVSCTIALQTSRDENLFAILDVAKGQLSGTYEYLRYMSPWQCRIT